MIGKVLGLGYVHLRSPAHVCRKKAPSSVQEEAINTDVNYHPSSKKALDTW
jgi:hypothetical protein